MERKNHYEILGINRGATRTEIKGAYRKAVLMNHPDLHPGDCGKEENIKKINEAYSVLSKPKKRAQYDRELLFTHTIEINPMGDSASFFISWTRFWFRFAKEVNKLLVS